jgi:hypothetical protein
MIRRIQYLRTAFPRTEAEATQRLQDLFYCGVGTKYLGFQIADEGQQADGSWKKLGKDGWRHWNVPTESVARRRWRPVHEHFKGLHRGVVSIGSSHVPFVSVDFDRHVASVDPKDHMLRVLKAGRLLRKHFPQLCWVGEVNPKNGSMKFFGIGVGPIPITEAEKVATQIHELLLQNGCGAVNHRGKLDLEVFPHNCVQVGLPMRMDKVTVISSGVLAKCVRKKRLEKDGPMVSFEAYSALTFVREIKLRGNYDETTLFREVKKGCANLPFAPASEPLITKTPSHRIKEEVVGGSSCVPRARGDYRDESNSFNRQQGALLELCRRLRRVATVDEGLRFIRSNRLFSGEWSENEKRRRDRVAYLLRRIAITFDPKKCRLSDDSLDIDKINIGKYDQWARRFVGKVTGINRHVDEFGKVVERRGASVDWRWVSVFLSVVEYCCVTSPNEDGTLPHIRAEQIWLALQASGRITAKWDDRKWKVARDWLERKGVIKIEDRNWVFGHGGGKAMKWAVCDGFDRLHIWWKTPRKSSGGEAIPLAVFLKSLRHTAPLKAYSQTAIPKSATWSPEAAPRGPPVGNRIKIGPFRPHN